MCCADDVALGLPPAVIEMVARYRRMREEQGFGWGEEALPDFFRWARFSRLGPVFDRFAATGDWAGAVRAAVGDVVPAGVVVVSIDAEAHCPRAPGRPARRSPLRRFRSTWWSTPDSTAPSSSR